MAPSDILPLSTDNDPGNSRTVPMEVLSLGVSRTATASMTAAYEILGIPTYHGFRFMSNPEEGVHWERAADAKFYGKGKLYSRDEWDRLLLGKFGGVADVGGYMFWQELLDLYPEAKAVLVERDVEKWYPSFMDGIVKTGKHPITRFILSYVEPIMGDRQRTANAARKLYMGHFGPVGERRPAKDWQEVGDNAKSVYRWYYDSVRKAVPAERLLNYELGSGWEPLCKFLGKPIPDVPFPHINEAQELKRRQWEATKDILRRAAVTALPYLVAVSSIAAGATLARRST